MNLIIFCLKFYCALTLNLAFATAATPTPTKIFQADFTKTVLSEVFGGSKISYGANNVKISPAGLNVTYPAGSWNPSGSPVGGFGLFTQNEVNKTGIFRYSIFFPKGFNFVKGGKLPGLYGGKTGCTGGDPAVDCFSTRLMWRTGGLGELYLYANRLAQNPSICALPTSDCNPTYGWSLSRGAFNFATGVWTDVEETVTMNTPGQQNGVVAIKINGVQVINYTNLVLRTSSYPNVVISGMDIETFFGGSTSDWSSPTRQTVQFKGFVLYSQ